MSYPFVLDENTIFNFLCYEIGNIIHILSNHHACLKILAEKWIEIISDDIFYISDIHHLLIESDKSLLNIGNYIMSESVYAQLISNINMLKFIVLIKTNFKLKFGKLYDKEDDELDSFISPEKLNNFTLLLIRSACVYYIQTCDLNEDNSQSNLEKVNHLKSRVEGEIDSIDSNIDKKNILKMLGEIYKYFDNIEIESDYEKTRLCEKYVDSLCRNFKFFMLTYKVLSGPKYKDFDINKELNKSLA